MPLKINIPDQIVDDCIRAHYTQMTWSMWPVDARSTSVERLENHIGEIVSAIIIKEVIHQRRLPLSK